MITSQFHLTLKYISEVKCGSQLTVYSKSTQPIRQDERNTLGKESCILLKIQREFQVRKQLPKIEFELDTVVNTSYLMKTAMGSLTSGQDLGFTHHSNMTTLQYTSALEEITMVKQSAKYSMKRYQSSLLPFCTFIAAICRCLPLAQLNLLFQGKSMPMLSVCV